MRPANIELTYSKTIVHQQHFTLAILSFLFFMWGVIVCLNNILIPHLKNTFSLSYGQAMLVQFCFFSAYFIMSIPAGSIIDKIGFKKGLSTGLLISSLGCLSFYPSAELQSYPMFLFSLFVLASGITFLQVSANPYVSLLGSPSSSATRLTIAQACNSLGTTVAPFIGGYFIFSQTTLLTSHSTHLSAVELANINLQNAKLVQAPYLALATILIVLAIFIASTNLYEIKRKNVTCNSNQTNTNSYKKDNLYNIWHSQNLKLGALAIFFYVGAEVAIGSFLVAYISQKNIGAISFDEASFYVPFYWGGALLGRILGAFFMPYFSPSKILITHAAFALLLLLITIFTSGSIAMIAILLVGLFNSIMFPTIFSLALNGLEELAIKGSGILCLSIVGGAIIPSLQGVLADKIGVQYSFILPALCYLYIMYFGLFTKFQLKKSNNK